MNRLNITYFFRKQLPQFHSIEELFSNIQKAMPDTVNFTNVYLPYHHGFINRIKNLIFAKKNSKQINHITGDINYIALGLPKENTIVTIHDIGSALKGNFIKKTVIKTFWFALPLRHCAKITVISEFSKNELLKNFKFLNKEKIVVIPNCISDDFFKISNGNKNSKPVILFIGTKENKNLERSIEAVAGIDVKLKIIGSLNKIQKELLEKYQIDFENYFDVSKEELLVHYSNSDLLLFPSLYEGFGMPVIEAQAANLPVITSDIEPMKTIAGDAAIVVNPYEIAEIKNAVKNIISKEKLKNELIEKGKVNAQKYSCSNVAEMYLKVYIEIASKL